jgi:predicted dehydrogenase
MTANTRLTRWGILGTGRIAGLFAEDIRTVEGAELTAVASRTMERACAFADLHGIPRRYGSWAQLAEDPEVDVVYVATPHTAHHPAASLMIEAGKSVLCEKPMALDAAQAADLADRAQLHGVFLMEAMWTLCLPAIRKIAEMIASGAIGEPRLVTADFGFTGPDDPRHRLRDPALGGGALLDIGVYPAALSQLVLGTPTAVTAAATLTPQGVDAATAFTLSHASGALAMLTCSIVCETPRSAVISGTDGMIQIDHFYSASGFELWRSRRLAEQVSVPYPGSHGLAPQAAEVMRCRREGLIESPLVPLSATLAVLRTLDEVRGQVGVRYPELHGPSAVRL